MGGLLLINMYRRTTISSIHKNGVLSSLGTQKRPKTPNNGGWAVKLETHLSLVPFADKLSSHVLHGGTSFIYRALCRFACIAARERTGCNLELAPLLHHVR